jgi:hypothetical protein
MSHQANEPDKRGASMAPHHGSIVLESEPGVALRRHMAKLQSRMVWFCRVSHVASHNKIGN